MWPNIVAHAKIIVHARPSIYHDKVRAKHAFVRAAINNTCVDGRRVQPVFSVLVATAPIRRLDRAQQLANNNIFFLTEVRISFSVAATLITTTTYNLKREELVLGLLILVPFGFVVGLMTSSPPDFPSSATLLSPDATAILFSLRLVFLCLGVHIGELLCFVALTGGIVTGKSTVSQLLAGGIQGDSYNY
jgi:hypothetical protein